MGIAATPEIEELKAELDRLQSGVGKAIDRLRDLTVGGAPNGHDTALATAEKIWSEVKQGAQTVGHEIEERPIVSALTAFGAGVALGMLCGGRRG